MKFINKFPGMFFSSLKMNECYPNGESPVRFYSRVKEAFMKLLNENRNKKILLVTHGGVIIIILSLIYGFHYSNLLKISPKTGSIIKLKWFLYIAVNQKNYFTWWTSI